MDVLNGNLIRLGLDIYYNNYNYHYNRIIYYNYDCLGLGFLIIETNKFLLVHFQFERSVERRSKPDVPSCVTQGNWRPGQLANTPP